MKRILHLLEIRMWLKKTKKKQKNKKKKNKQKKKKTTTKNKQIHKYTNDQLIISMMIKDDVSVGNLGLLSVLLFMRNDIKIVHQIFLDKWKEFYYC